MFKATILDLKNFIGTLTNIENPKSNGFYYLNNTSRSDLEILTDHLSNIEDQERKEIRRILKS